jgi:hypothetical protein
VQIEVVGFAGRPKDAVTLRSVARLCRWIEGEHGVVQQWPNGPPRPPINGNDPGAHNRNAANWVTQGGHYGHSQVPENTHWDPAYTAAELAIVTPGAQVDPHEALGMAGVAPGLAGESSGQVTADEIAERVLARLSQSTDFARLTVRVVVGGVHVEVTAERGAPPRKGLKRARRPSSVRARARRGGSRGRGR